MFGTLPSKFVRSTVLGSVLLLAAMVVGQVSSPFEPSVPVKHLEPDLSGQMVPWGHVGSHVGDETINPMDQMEFVWVPGGSFVLGTNDLDQEGKLSSAHPFRNISLSGFWISKYPVTWGQYSGYCQKQNIPLPREPGFPKTSLHPVVNVNWSQANAYAKWAHVSLPTEFQWERASRGPQNYNYPWGNNWDASKCVNSVEHTSTSTTPVGKAAGARSGFGCYDMTGNVSQWCSNWASKDYTEVASKDPQGPGAGTYRTLRGGGWGGLNPVLYRSSFRFRLTPDVRLDICGFRCVATF